MPYPIKFDLDARIKQLLPGVQRARLDGSDLGTGQLWLYRPDAASTSYTPENHILARRLAEAEQASLQAYMNAYQASPSIVLFDVAKQEEAPIDTPIFHSYESIDYPEHSSLPLGQLLYQLDIPPAFLDYIFEMDTEASIKDIETNSHYLARFKPYGVLALANLLKKHVWHHPHELVEPNQS